ncbi:MAG: sugar ABC transporter permease, partial [Nitrososphaeria archaeon]
FLSIFLIYPTLYQIYLSFYDIYLINPEQGKFIGLTNYLKALRDPSITYSIYLTLLFTFLTVILELFLGLGIALLLDRPWKGIKILETIVMLPFFAMPIVSGLIWKFLWDTDWGVINYILYLFFGIKIGTLNWLGDPILAFLAIVVTEVWNHTPFAVLVLLASLKAIPIQSIESAKIDGATTTQIFRHIILPFLSPAILIVLTFRTIFNLRVFDVIYSLTAGGPGNATCLMSLNIYFSAFRYYQAGYGGALAVILLLITLLIGLIYFKLLYGKLEV